MTHPVNIPNSQLITPSSNFNQISLALKYLRDNQLFFKKFLNSWST